MYIKKHWSRRDFIRAAGLSGVAAALTPFIPTLSTEAAAQTTGLKRILLVTTGNGTILWNWRNNGAGAPFQNGQPLPQLQGPILAPLDAYRDNLILLDGIDLTSLFTPKIGRSNLSHHGHSAVWTGRNGAGIPLGGGVFYPDGASIEQIINAEIGGGRRTIQSTTWRRNSDPRSVGSYDLNGTPLPCEVSPQAVFDAVFRDGFDNDGGEVDTTRLSRRKRSVDLLRSELARVRSELPTEDRYRLDAHVEGLATLESRFEAAAVPISCSTSAADRPTITGVNYQNSTPETADQHMDVITHAFACDQVRAAHFVLGPENSWGRDFGAFVPGFTGGVHTNSHEANQGATAAVRQRAIDNMTALNHFFATQMRAMLDKLATANLLEDTLVVWGMGLNHGGMHSNRNTPYVVFQGDQGPWTTGRYHRFGSYELDDAKCLGGAGPAECQAAHGGETNNNLLISIAHAMGLANVTSVGDAMFCRPDGLDATLI